MKVKSSKEDISENSYIERDKETKSAFLHVVKSGEWKLYAGNSTEDIDLSVWVAQGKDAGVFPLPVSASQRMYFLFSTDQEDAVMAEKHLPMQGGYNFRDLGGIKTKDGRNIKWGRLFRGDELHELTQADLDYLSSIPIVSVVDFRTRNEVERVPNKTPKSVHEYYSLPIAPGNLTVMWKGMDINKVLYAEVESAMMQLYELLVNDPESTRQYKTFFALLQDESKVPVLYHCSAGKDRTGMASALILFGLGVDEDIIIHDYLLSNKYLEQKYALMKTKYPSIAPVYEAKTIFIQTGIQKIRESYGTVENYLEKVLDVNIEKMRTMYLD